VLTWYSIVFGRKERRKQVGWSGYVKKYSWQILRKKITLVKLRKKYVETKEPV
jgi:hypothetical protein